MDGAAPELVNPAPGEKRCVTCKVVKPLSEYNRRRASADGKQPSCRECNRAWHERNKEHHNRLIHERTRRMRDEIQQRILDYLLHHPCVDCGESDPVVLEFDHLGEKVDNVSGLARRMVRWELIEAEIAKCEVRCANCHRRRTMETLRSYRWLQAGG
jgi:hypothetical protein